MACPTPVWVSSNTAVATVGSAGLALAAGIGNTTISATLNSITGSANLRVNGVPGSLWQGIHWQGVRIH